MPNLVPFLVLLFLIAALLRVDFFFTIAYLFAIVLLFTRLWTEYAAARLEVRRRLIPRAFIGDEVEVELQVRNGGRLPLVWVDVRDSFPADLASPPFHREVLSLGPREERRLCYRLTCRRRGYYPLGPFAVQTGDWLGLQPSIEVYPPDAELSDYLIVYPRVVPLEHLGLPTRSPLATLPARAALVEDPARIMGVRDYQDGDSLRRMHWTASARAGRWLVKRYEPAMARDTLLALDLCAEAYELRHRYDAPEMAIVVAASLANHIVVREGLAVGLSALAWDPLTAAPQTFSLPPRNERAHLIGVLEVLARVTLIPPAANAAAEGAFAHFLRQETVRLPWGTTVVVLTGQATPLLLDTLGQLRQSGFAVALILARRAMTPLPLQERAKVLGIPLYHVWQERDLEALA